MTNQDFPVEGVEMSVLLVVGDLDRARAFYRDLLGATEVCEYGGTSAVLPDEDVTRRPARGRSTESKGIERGWHINRS
jgi:catechol 2,3-dioxygenase-like lactoylglutathione lyase family enzyme